MISYLQAFPISIIRSSKCRATRSESRKGTMYLISEPRPKVSEHYQVNRVFEHYDAIGEAAFDGWKTFTKAKNATRSIWMRDCMHQGRSDYALTLTPSRRLLRDMLMYCGPVMRHRVALVTPRFLVP